ncbi:HU family DNA-binding protein [bacterium]|nr:HU family DNA-binding protein [bacterium]
MTKAEIVDIISGGTGLTKIETAAVVDGFLATVAHALRKGDHVELRGFGTFCLRERKEKHVANPRTGKMMHIPHRLVPDFKPSPHLKEDVVREMTEAGKFHSESATGRMEETGGEEDPGPQTSDPVVDDWEDLFEP